MKKKIVGIFVCMLVMTAAVVTAAEIMNITTPRKIDKKIKTDTKEDSGIPCGIEMIEIVRNSVSIPIIAVGGINKDNISDVIQMGADGVIAVSAVLESENIYDTVKDFIEIITEVKNR